MALRLRLLGGLDADGIGFAQLGSRKSRRLLARLALGRGRAVSADALVEVLWPEEDRPARVNDQLSVLVSRLRAVLSAERLPRLGGGYALKLDWLDIDAQAALLQEARKRLDAGSLAPARAAIDAAVALTRGPLLPDEPEASWLEGERAAAARHSAEVRRTAAEIALAAGDPWAAADSAWVTLADEPYDESALRLLMRALSATGRATQAITAYSAFKERLSEELGIDPAAQTVESYVELLRAKPVLPPPPAMLPLAMLPGRAQELAILHAAAQRSHDDGALVVKVCGEAGIGKSRLLDAFADALPERQTILRAAGSELGAGLPLQPILDPLSVHLRRNPHLDAGLLAPFLSGAAASPDTARVLTFFGDGSGGQALLFTALDTLMLALAEHGPVTLLIDDGHWLDRASLAWIGHVPQRLAGAPLLVVVAHRPGEGTTPPGSQVISLGPLDAEATAQIVGSDRAADLHARSGGHPLFLVELARADEGALPDSIRDSVVIRCEQAGVAAPTLRAAAVLGPEVDLDLLAAVLDAPPSNLLDHLEEGVRRALLAEQGTRFVFRHQLIREALCAATGASRTALLHRQAAHCLSLRAGSRAPWEVAYHARLGGDLALAASALAEAGELAAARFDHDEALRLFDEALSVEDTPELRLRRARAALPAGRFEQASTDAGIALAGGLGAAGMEVAAITAYLLRDFHRCRRLAEDGARLADDPVLRTSCLALAGRVSHVAGDLTAAERLLAQALAEAPASTRPLAALWAAPLRTDRGDPGGALELLKEAVSAMAARHPFVVPHRHLAAGSALGKLGRVDEALAELTLADGAAQSQHTKRFAARIDNCRAWIMRGTGDHEAADRRNELAYQASVGEPGMTEPIVDALLGLAEGRLYAADITGATALLEQAHHHLATPHPFAWRHRLQARLLEARLARSAGDEPTAAALEAEVAAETDRLGIYLPPPA